MISNRTTDLFNELSAGMVWPADQQEAAIARLDVLRKVAAIHHPDLHAAKVEHAP